jgi:hypothetical protein
MPARDDAAAALRPELWPFYHLNDASDPCSPLPVARHANSSGGENIVGSAGISFDNGGQLIEKVSHRLQRTAGGSHHAEGPETVPAPPQVAGDSRTRPRARRRAPPPAPGRARLEAPGNVPPAPPGGPCRPPAAKRTPLQASPGPALGLFELAPAPSHAIALRPRASSSSR